MTFAVIHTGGKQYKVSANDKLRLEKLNNKEGGIVEFDQVLLTNKNNEIDIGAPIVQGAKVESKILNQTKNKTILIFKKRRRQNSRRKKGHRQKISVVQIIKIFGKNGQLLSEADKKVEIGILSKTKDKIKNEQQELTKNKQEKRVVEKITD